MAVATSRVPTAHASRYLQQLCKHWGHKFEVQFTPTDGRIQMSAATLILDADAEGLAATQRTSHQRQDKINIMNHQIEHDPDVG